MCVQVERRQGEREMVNPEDGSDDAAVNAIVHREKNGPGGSWVYTVTSSFASCSCNAESCDACVCQELATIPQPPDPRMKRPGGMTNLVSGGQDVGSVDRGWDQLNGFGSDLATFNGINVFTPSAYRQSHSGELSAAAVETGNVDNAQVAVNALAAVLVTLLLALLGPARHRVAARGPGADDVLERLEAEAIGCCRIKSRKWSAQIGHG